MSLSVALFASASALMLLSCIAVGLRLFVRIWMIKSVGIDDYLIVVALIGYIGAESFVFDATILTQGKTLLEVLDVLSRGLLDIYLGEIFYVISVWTLKLSIGTFLLRIVQSKRLKYTIYGTLTLVSVYNTVYICLVIFQCTPVNHAWLPLTKGHCLPGHVITSTSYAQAALTGFSDLLFASLPIFVVWNLQMNTAMKVSVAGLLGLGAIAGVTSFVRMPYLKALAEANPIDFFVVTYRLAIWTCVEPGVGIFVGSVATLRPLFKKALGGSSNGGGYFFNSRSKAGGSSSSHPVGRSRNSQYIRSGSGNSPLPSPYKLDSFSTNNKKSGFTTTVVEGSAMKNGRKWGASHDHFDGSSSQEELNLKANLSRSQSVSKEQIQIQRTVEFEAIVTPNHARETPTPTKEEPFAARGGFY